MPSFAQIEILLPQLKAYALSLCDVSEDAEDLVQDAIERALRADGRPKKPDALRPWMFRVMRNLHFDELRKMRVRREYLAAQKQLSQDLINKDVMRDMLVRLAFDALKCRFQA